MASASYKHGTHTRVPMVSEDGHHAIVRTVCVVPVLSTADRRLEAARTTDSV